MGRESRLDIGLCYESGTSRCLVVGSFPVLAMLLSTITTNLGAYFERVSE